MAHDLSKDFDDHGYSIYLPAISGFYTRQINQVRKNSDFYAEERIPEGLEKGIDGLDFLKKKDSYYYCKYGLYSAGHAQLDLERAKEEECMIHKRDRETTVILGDSGGFQVGKGVIKMDWTNALDPNDPAREELCGKILNWLENTADWSMTLDVPAWAATNMSEYTGLSSVEDAMEVTLHNLHYFMKNRTPGKTKFLSVLSGIDRKNCQDWYDMVKGFSDPNTVEEMGYDRDKTLEGFALAGAHTDDMAVALERLLNLRDDGLLEGKDWIHVLGVGRLNWGCHLTSIQRVLRKHYNQNLTVSYDAASPFVAVAYGQMYNYHSLTSKRFNYLTSKPVDNKRLVGTETPMPFQGPIMDRLLTRDICPLTDDHALVNGQPIYDITKEEFSELQKIHTDAIWVDEKLNRLGKPSRTSWDTLSYLLLMSHNVHHHVEAVVQANKLADMEYERLQPYWRDYIADKKSANSNNISPFVPHTILYFRNFVEELFDPATKDPYKLLDEARPFVNSLGFGSSRSSGKASVFNEFFEATGDEDQGIEQFADINDEKITNLENDIL